MTIFHNESCNAIGTPEGWIELEAGEDIKDITSLDGVKWLNYYPDPHDIMSTTPFRECHPSPEWYKLEASGTGFHLALIPGDIPLLKKGGHTINCRNLSDGWSNGLRLPNTFEVQDFPILNN